MRLPRDSKEFIELLNSAGVRYVIVGAYALAYHGRPRLTGDIDVFIEASAENAQRVESVLQKFGFGGIGLSAKDFLIADTIVQLGFPPNRIDVVTGLTGVDFADAWDSKVTGRLGDVPVFFIGKDCLLRNKRAAGRPKDLADIDELEGGGAVV